MVGINKFYIPLGIQSSSRLNLLMPRYRYGWVNIYKSNSFSVSILTDGLVSITAKYLTIILVNLMSSLEMLWLKKIRVTGSLCLSKLSVSSMKRGK